MSADWITLEVEINVHVFAEPARVIVSVRLGVTKRFQDTVRLKQNVFDSVQHSSGDPVKSMSQESYLWSNEVQSSWCHLHFWSC